MNDQLRNLPKVLYTNECRADQGFLSFRLRLINNRSGYIQRSATYSLPDYLILIHARDFSLVDACRIIKVYLSIASWCQLVGLMFTKVIGFEVWDP